jgi:hypothetical protein
MLLVITTVVFFGLMLVLGFILVMMGTADSQGDGAADQRTLDDDITPGGLEDRGSGFFQGKQVHTSRERSISLHQLEAMLRDGHMRAVLPWLLTIGGLLGLVISIGPLLWYLVEEKWVAYVWMAATSYALINIGWQYVRSSKGS